MTNERTAGSDWRTVLAAGVVCVAMLAVFAYSLMESFSGFTPGDPLAPVMAIFAVILSAVLALIVGFGLMMLFGNLTE